MDKSPNPFGRAGRPAAGPAWLAGVLGAGLLALTSGNAGAQGQPAPDATAPQSSTEPGQTPLGDSFETEEDRLERIREQRRQAFEDTKFDV